MDGRIPLSISDEAPRFGVPFTMNSGANYSLNPPPVTKFVPAAKSYNIQGNSQGGESAQYGIDGYSELKSFVNSQPSDMITEIIRWPTNPKNIWTIIPFKFQESSWNEYLDGQLIFIKKVNDVLYQKNGHVNSILRDNNNGYTKRLHSQSKIVMNLPRLNYMLCKKDPIVTSVFDQTTSADILQDWILFGMINNESGGVNPYPCPEDPKLRTVLNCVIRGPCYIYNIWGGNFVPGTKLFLILKRVPRIQLPLKYIMDTRGTAKQAALTEAEYKALGPAYAKNYDDMARRGNIDTTDGMGTHPFQILPWASNGYDYPPASVTTYVDAFGIERKGEVIMFGITLYGELSQKGVRNFDAKFNSSNSATHMAARPKIFVLANML